MCEMRTLIVIGDMYRAAIPRGPSESVRATLESAPCLQTLHLQYGSDSLSKCRSRDWKARDIQSSRYLEDNR